MLPHERALVKRLANEPFALIGINSDGETEEVLPKLKEANINWRQAMDVTPSGPWATKWNVSGWPTLYLLDAKGVIREKWIGSPGDAVLDSKIDELLAEAKAGR